MNAAAFYNQYHSIQLTLLSCPQFGGPGPCALPVNGVAVGLGATLALFCDVIFASPAARFADTHVTAGVVAGDGGAVMWPLLMGPVRAKHYLMTGDFISAEKAAAISCA